MVPMVFCGAHGAGLVCQISSQSDLWCEGRGLPKNAFSSLNYSATICLADWAYILIKVDAHHFQSLGSFKFLAHSISGEFELKQQTTNNNNDDNNNNNNNNNKPVQF